MENKEYRITLRKIYGHLKTVLVHKYHVGRYCFMCHLYLQGITITGRCGWTILRRV